MQKKILILSHIIPFSPSAGNEIRLLKLLQWFKKEGYVVIVLFRTQSLSNEAREYLSQFIDHIYILTDFTFTAQNAFFSKTILNKFSSHFIGKDADESKKKFCPPDFISAANVLRDRYKPDIVIAEYIFMAPALAEFPESCLKIIDTHDVFSRKEEYVEKFGIKDPFTCTPEEERQLLLKADVIIAIQSVEAEILSELVPERKIITVSIDFDVDSATDALVPENHSLLIVGSDNPLNIHGLKEFLIHCWPLVKAQKLESSLKIIGKIGDAIEDGRTDIYKLGWIDDLTAEYDKAEIVLNPTRAGTGLKIKTVEALCRGKPIVTFANGAEGLSFQGEPPFVVVDSWEQFSNATLDLLDSEQKRKKLQKRSIEYAKQEFSITKVYGELQSTIHTHFLNTT